MKVRRYGENGPNVVVLHGGPGAPGCAGPLAEGLAKSFCVLEPFQRGSSEKPLTVLQHVADLLSLVETECPRESPALVGESWGAMLALACAAAHPDRFGPLVLVGCGTFDQASRTRLQEIRQERITEFKSKHDQSSSEEPSDPLKKAIKWHQITDNYNCSEGPDVEFDMQACTETLEDMRRSEQAGLYPQAFSAITSPVIMIHGDYDPHPGQMIRACLQAHIPQLEYRELKNCGHSPWLEKASKDEFFALAADWLNQHLA